MSGTHAVVSTAIEDYVLAIYRIQVNGEPVVGARLAEQLHVAPASVTEMVTRLRREGLVEPGHPIHLAEPGLRMARTLATRHRLVECFLVDVLGFGWDEVHEEAHRLEHALSAVVTDRLAAFLGHPTRCPHGHPIMEAGATEPDLHLSPLTALAPGGGGVVRRILNEDTGLLRRLRDLGIGLDTEVRLAGSDGADGPLRIEVGGAARVIDRAAAGAVLIEAGASEEQR